MGDFWTYKLAAVRGKPVRKQVFHVFWWRSKLNFRNASRFINMTQIQRVISRIFFMRLNQSVRGKFVFSFEILDSLYCRWWRKFYCRVRNYLIASEQRILIRRGSLKEISLGVSLDGCLRLEFVKIGGENVVIGCGSVLEEGVVHFFSKSIIDSLMGESHFCDLWIGELFVGFCVFFWVGDVHNKINFNSKREFHESITIWK